MLTGLISAALLAQAPVAKDIQAFLVQVQKGSPISVKVVETANDSMAKINQTVLLNFQTPNRFQFRIDEPPNATRYSTSRGYSVEGSKLTILEPDTNQYTVRELAKVHTIAEKFALSMAPLPDSIKILIDAKSASAILTPLGKLKGWGTTQKGSRRIHTLVQRAGNGRSMKTVIAFEGTRLAQIQFDQPQRNLTWTYTKPMLPYRFSLPKGAVKVTSFVEKLPLPKFEDAKVRSIFTKGIQFYDKHKSGEILANDDAGVVRIWRSGSKIREESQGHQWTYDGKTVSAANIRRRLFGTSAANPLGAINKLGNMGISMHSLSRTILLGENPVRNWVPPTATVSIVGSLKRSGMECYLLDSRSPGMRTTLYLRKSDSALMGVDARTVDVRGKTVTSHSMGFYYERTGKPISASRFSIAQPKGFQKVKM